jgi:hypothetical protein
LAGGLANDPGDSGAVENTKIHHIIIDSMINVTLVSPEKGAIFAGGGNIYCYPLNSYDL